MMPNRNRAFEHRVPSKRPRRRRGCAFLFLVLAAVVTLLCSGCVSSHKTYLPPSNVKVTASTKKVTDGAVAAHASARAAKTHVEAAQKHNDALLVTGLDLQQKLDAIIKLAPAELQSALAEVKGDAVEIQQHADGMQVELTGAHTKQNETEAFQVKLDQDIAQLKKDQGEYQSNAQGLADSATSERENLIKTQKALVASRFGGILMKLGAILFVVVAIGLVVLWFMGKISIGAGRVAAKIAI